MIHGGLGHIDENVNVLSSIKSAVKFLLHRRHFLALPRYPSLNPRLLFYLDPFGGAKPRLLRREKAPLRVNPEQAQAFRPGSRRVDI
jgi:hypothetical protein